MCPPLEGIDFVWLDEADFSMGKDIPTAGDECGLSLETVSPALMFQSRLWHQGRATLLARLLFNPDRLDEMAPVSHAGKC